MNTILFFLNIKRCKTFSGLTIALQTRNRAKLVTFYCYLVSLSNALTRFNDEKVT